MDQPHPRDVAPDQHRRPRHRAGVHPLADHHPRRRAAPPAAPAPRSRGSRAPGRRAHGRGRGSGCPPPAGAPGAASSFAPRPAGRRRPCRRCRPTGASCAGSPNSTSVPNSCPQVGVLPLVEHRGLVDQPDVERLVAPLPALDEVRAAQPRARQRPGDRRMLPVERHRPVERRLGQPLDLRPLALAGQPLGDRLVVGMIERRVEDAVDRRRRHPAAAQHARRLVGRRQHRQRAPASAPCGSRSRPRPARPRPRSARAPGRRAAWSCPTRPCRPPPASAAARRRRAAAPPAARSTPAAASTAAMRSRARA